jgi:hypothetical protein
LAGRAITTMHDAEKRIRSPGLVASGGQCTGGAGQNKLQEEESLPRKYRPEYEVPRSGFGISSLRRVN